MRIALLFPGQGAQRVGMGRDLAEHYDIARDTFRQADEVLGVGLSRMAFEGPQEELTLTENTQPAIYTCAVAGLRVLQEHGVRADVALGHSIGEYPALVAAGALGFAEGLRLVRERGRLMAECAARTKGAMAALVGMEDDDVVALVERTGRGRVLCASLFNAPGQVVVSGEIEAVDELCDQARNAGARRVVRLEVSGAWHTPLMQEAAEAFAAAVDSAEIGDPGIPVIANVSAEPVTTAADIRASLKAQIVGAVLWRQSLARLADYAVAHAVEVGAQGVVAGMVRRSVEGVEAHSVYDRASLEKVLELVA